MKRFKVTSAGKLASDMLGSDLKRYVKGKYVWARANYVRWRYCFDPDQLGAALARVGLHPGDTVLVHVSYDRFLGFTGGPATVIEILQRLLKPQGTLLMPTLPFSGSALEYVNKRIITDLKRTPSAMGLVTELFRRMPGVLRSCHPTHPVAAWGAGADRLTRNHHECATPCGAGSPYLRLLEVDGKILFLGADISAMTFFHGIEEVIESKMPVSPFTRDWFDLETRGHAGVMYMTRTRLYDPSLSARRDVSLLLPELIRNSAWRTERLGLLDIALTKATDVLRACEQMAEQGLFCYR
jgi:aminoglycoside 3-N-acetyltransferase